MEFLTEKAPKQTLKAVPTNIITGFLGVGKTSAILNLLKHKPASEKWAVLVNEFGEIGVDGSLFEGQHAENNGVFVREVPGGCMCCAAGLPMQIALNQLLTRAKPDRLLIEPTGLGHPKEVLQVLNEKYYANILRIQKNVTLIDARKLRDERYTNHETFNQQIDVADIIIGNKLDLYEEDDKTALEAYITQRAETQSKKEVPSVIYANYGEFSPSILEGDSNIQTHHHHHHHHHSEKPVTFDEPPIPECGYLQVENEGEGFHSIGWRFSPDIVFDYETLFHWLNGLQVERLKAVFITCDGVFGFNMTPDALSQTELDDCMESRIEIIAPEINPQWEKDLLGILQPDSP